MSKRRLFIDSLVGFDLSDTISLVRDVGITALMASDDGRALLMYMRRSVAQLYTIRDFLKHNPIYGYVPNRAQDRFHYNPARGRGCFWPNRVGKTVGLVTEAYAHAIGKRLWLHPDDEFYHVDVRAGNVGRIYVTSYDKWEQDVQQEWERWIPSSEYAFERDGRHVKKIRFARTNSVIYLMTNDQKFKVSEGGKLDWAAFNEPISKPHFTGTLRGLMDSNGPWWMNMTLIDEDRWIYDEIWEMAETDSEIAVIQADLADNLVANGGSLTIEAIEAFYADDILFDATVDYLTDLEGNK